LPQRLSLRNLSRGKQNAARSRDHQLDRIPPVQFLLLSLAPLPILPILHNTIATNENAQPIALTQGDDGWANSFPANFNSQIAIQPAGYAWSTTIPSGGPT
jgi:hypothetical protein